MGFGINTINNEQTAKNDALAEANSDIKNLLDSTLIATLFLDTDLRIRNFTPAMTEIFHMRAGDRGPPITDIVTRLNYPDLICDVKEVLDSLSPDEQECMTLFAVIGTSASRDAVPQRRTRRTAFLALDHAQRSGRRRLTLYPPRCSVLGECLW